MSSYNKSLNLQFLQFVRIDFSTVQYCFTIFHPHTFNHTELVLILSDMADVSFFAESGNFRMKKINVAQSSVCAKVPSE